MITNKRSFYEEHNGRFLIFLSSAAYADINLYGPGGPHTALLDAAKLYAEKTGIIVNVHYGPQNKWNEDAQKMQISCLAHQNNLLWLSFGTIKTASVKKIFSLFICEKVFYW